MQDRINIATKDSYKVKGNIIFSNLPASDNNVGDVYNITDAFTADETFIPSEVGNKYPPNINVVYTSEGWDILGGVYDFSEFMYKEDIKPISDDDITESLVLPEPVAVIKVGDLTFEGVQDNITFDAVFDEPQMITIDEPEYGRDLHYAITDTPVTSTFSGMRKARAASPFDSLSWIKYTGPFSLQYGNNIIYTRVISLDGQPIYNSSNGVHIHKYTDLGITSPATCLTNAVKTHKCDHCDDSYTEVLENTALGHDYVRTIQRPASCLENEIDTIACSRCDSSYTEEMPNTALGHNYVRSVQRQASCLENEIDLIQCSRCNDNHTEEMPNTALGHAYNSGVITTPATCIGNGAKTFTCSRCNGTKTETIPSDPNAHNLIAEEYIVANANCTTAGSKYTRKCSLCNNRFNLTTIPALGHAYRWVTTTAATCAASGQKQNLCSRCNANSGTQAIAPLLHNWNNSVCSNCGAQMPTVAGINNAGVSKITIGSQVYTNVASSINIGSNDVIINFDNSNAKKIGMVDATSGYRRTMITGSSNVVTITPDHISSRFDLYSSGCYIEIISVASEPYKFTYIPILSY